MKQIVQKKKITIGFKKFKKCEENLGFGENINPEHHSQDCQVIFSLF